MTTTSPTTRPVSDPYFFGACVTCHGPIEYLGRTLNGGLLLLEPPPVLSPGEWWGVTVVDLVGCPVCRIFEVAQCHSERRLPHEIPEDTRREWAAVTGEVADWTEVDRLRATHLPGDQCTLLCLERLLERLAPDVAAGVTAAVAAMTRRVCAGPPNTPAGKPGDQADDVSF